MAETKKPDKRTVLRELADKLAKAYLDELMAEKRHQDARQVLFGARTPTAGDKANIEATRKALLAKARVRVGILAEMDTVLGIERAKKTPPGQVLDQADPE